MTGSSIPSLLDGRSKGSTPLQALGYSFPFITSFINNMRKIEREMIQAIVDRRDWHKANTSVDITPMYAEIRLHNHLIAKYNLSNMDLIISHCGWTTNTTKSRLNSLCSFVTGKCAVFQKNFEWFLTKSNGETVEFMDGFYTV